MLVQRLKGLLDGIVDNDNNYDMRYRLVIEAMYVAKLLDYQVGVRLDPKEPEWPVFYIELPTGQVSWHMPQHEKPWDGHTTEEKFERISKFY